MTDRGPLVQFPHIRSGQRRLAAREAWLRQAAEWAAVAWQVEEPIRHPDDGPAGESPQDWWWSLVFPDDNGLLFVNEPDGRGRPWRVQVLDSDLIEGTASTLLLAQSAAVGAARAFVAQMARALGGHVEWFAMPPVADPQTTNDPGA